MEEAAKINMMRVRVCMLVRVQASKQYALNFLYTYIYESMCIYASVCIDE